MERPHTGPDDGPSTRLVGIFAMGGTIAMSSAPGPSVQRGSTADPLPAAGAVPRLTGVDLVASVPGLDRTGIAVEVHDVRQVPSAWLGVPDVVELADRIDARLADGSIEGAVVVQGTDTIEETSWLLDLILRHEAPVVVTGAMRHAGMAGGDGPANLLAAIQVAASPVARGLGVTVAFADDLHAARAVRKAHTTSVAAFASPGTGPLGHLREGRLRVWSRPGRPVVPAAARARADGRLGTSRVVLVPMTFDDGGTLLRAVAGMAPERHGGTRGEAGRSGQVDGLVIAGFGAGHVPAAVLDVVTDLAGRIPVVLAARGHAGPVLASTYGFAGSESDLLARGLVGAGDLDAYKARLLLQVLLDGGADGDEIRQAFAWTW